MPGEHTAAASPSPQVPGVDVIPQPGCLPVPEAKRFSKARRRHLPALLKRAHEHAHR